MPVSRKRPIRRRGPFYAYLIRCADNSLYAGCTHDLEKRLLLHNSGKGAKYVRGRVPARFVYASAYRQYRSALRMERTLKAMTKKQKETLVCGSSIASKGALSGRAVRSPSAGVGLKG